MTTWPTTSARRASTARWRGPPSDDRLAVALGGDRPEQADVERRRALAVASASPRFTGRTLRAVRRRSDEHAAATRRARVASVPAVGSRHFRAGVVIVVRARTAGCWRSSGPTRPGSGSCRRAGWRRRVARSTRRGASCGEETGLGPDDVELVGEHPEWVLYEWPDDVVDGGARLGQVHRWFLFRILDEDTEPTPDGREFRAWRWVEPAWLVEQVVPFRRPGLRTRARRRPMSDDLFTAAAEERLRSQAPLAARLRPRTIDDVVGQPQLLGPGRPLRRLVEQDRLSSVLLWGPPGTGKTTLALAVAGTTARAFEQLSAVTAGVKDVREVIERARQRLGERDQGTILFLDEIHRFTKAQQDALLPAVEDGTLVLIGATTENPFFEVNPPLRSRSTLFRLEPLGPDDLRVLVGRGLEALGRPPPTDAARPARRAQRRRRPAGADVARGRRRARPSRRRSSWPTPRRRSARAPCATGATTTTT